MWTRSELKAQARSALKGTFLISVLVVVLYLIITGGGNSDLTLKLGEDAVNETQISSGILSYDYLGDVVSLPITAFFLMFGVLAGFVSALWSIFIAGPVNIGLSKYFLVNKRNKEDNTPMNLFYPFKSGYYLNTVLVSFMKNLFIFLFFLLLIIPGIIKIFAYYMVPWIMADNPSMSYKEALALSTEMTMGQKMNIFVLELSFIGWYLLTVLTLGLASPLVTTYRNATVAELYDHLKNRGNELNASPEYF